MTRKSSGAEDTAVTLLRLAVGIIFMAHGWGKVTDVAGTAQSFAALGIPEPQIMVYVAIAGEFVGGLGLVLGFLTRIAALAIPPAWTDVWIGGGITGALYMIGSALIVVKLGHSPLATFYGGAGSLVLVLLWAYYSSQIFLFGASFIAVYATEYGSLVRPADGAVAVHSAAKGESDEEE